jgi:Fic family protein
MSLGYFEVDDHGRKLFRPSVPPFPPLEAVHDLLVPAVTAIGEFDRRLKEWDRAGSVGRLFARLDAVHSSGAEGSTTTFTDLMEFETSLKVAPDVDDAQSVAACAEAFDAEANRAADLASTVLRIHKRLFERSRSRFARQSAGQFKTAANSTRDDELPEGQFYYTSPASLETVFAEWEAFSLDSRPDTPELVRQILSHWMFEQMHPVADGNGRIGRLLVPILLKRKQATSLACAFFGEAVDENKQLYIDALKGTRTSGRTAILTRQMLAFITTTAQANLERLSKLASLENQWRAAVKVRSDSVVYKLLPYMLTKPAFTVREAADEIHAGFAAVNQAAKVLAKAGILSVPNDAKRDRLFRVDGVLDLFDRFRPQPISAPQP